MIGEGEEETVNAERPKNDLWKFSEEIYSISCAKTRHGFETAPHVLAEWHFTWLEENMLLI